MQIYELPIMETNEPLCFQKYSHKRLSILSEPQLFEENETKFE